MRIVVDQTFVNPSLTQRTIYNGICNEMANAGAKFGATDSLTVGAFHDNHNQIICVLLHFSG
jgi:hypothetical protein